MKKKSSSDARASTANLTVKLWEKRGSLLQAYYTFSGTWATLKNATTDKVP